MSHVIDIDDYMPINLDLKNKVDDIDLKCKQSFNVVQNEISDLKTTLDSVGTQASKLQESFQHLSEAIQCSSISNRSMLLQIREAKEQFKNNETTLKELKIKDNALDAGIAMLAKIQDSQQVVLNLHEKMITELKSTFDQLFYFSASRTSKVTTILEGLDERLSVLESKNKKRKFDIFSNPITPSDSPSTIGEVSPLDLRCHDSMHDEDARDGFESIEGQKNTVTYSSTVLNSILKQ